MYHVTSIESLYSGFLRSRTKTGSQKGFSSKTSGNPDYVYLTTPSYKPIPDKIVLMFDSSLLLDRARSARGCFAPHRDDYYLNTTWSYDITPETRTSKDLVEWLQTHRGMDEILFQNEIPLDLYLKEIIVPEIPSHIKDIIKQQNPNTIFPTLDKSKIPSKYEDYLFTLVHLRWKMED